MKESYIYRNTFHLYVFNSLDKNANFINITYEVSVYFIQKLNETNDCLKQT